VSMQKTSLEKLRPGPGLPAAEVALHQKRRIRTALVELIADGGVETVTVRSLTRNAGISSRAFYAHFNGVDQSVALTVDWILAEIADRANARRSSQDDWKGRIRSVVDSAMESFAADPVTARVALVDAAAAGPEARRVVTGRAVGFEELIVGCLDAGGRKVPTPRHLVGGMAAGLLHVARQTTMEGRVSELPELSSQLSDWLVSLPAAEVLALRAERSGDPSSFRRDGSEGVAPPDAGDPFDERQRLMRATVRLALRGGFRSLSGSRIRAEAGVSLKRFDSYFSGPTDCFLQAIDSSATALIRRSAEVTGDGKDWDRAAYRTVQALTAWASHNKEIAALMLAGVLEPGRAGLLTREALIHRAGRALGQTVMPGGVDHGLAAEASVAAVWHIAQVDLLTGRSALPRVAPLLGYVLLVPFLGAAGAIESVLSKPRA
jgi:AcrR family transcriptional regulator